MPHQKGRARNTVPQKFDRKHKKFVPSQAETGSAVAAAANAAAKCVYRSRLLSDVDQNHDGTLPLPAELWVRVELFAGALELCRAEALSRASRCLLLEHEGTLWEPLCHLDFPSMWNSVKKCNSQPSTPVQCPNLLSPAPLLSPLSMPSSSPRALEGIPSLPPPKTTASEQEVYPKLATEYPGDHEGGDVSLEWKLCYARRFLKQRAWDAMRGRTRSSSSTSEGSEALPNSSRLCTSCGERFGGATSTECRFHPGEFLPTSASDDAAAVPIWSRAELSQLQALVRAAWRAAGGSTGVRRNARNYKGGGHWAKYMGFKGWGSRGHWAEGCGPRPGSSLLRACIDGKVPCSWSCCGSEVLISEGCNQGAHR
eukprot:TRINITY_DN96278_c0_g1_i1.p1 TRINITY_DN96278_c0_g1~~TRINITY_DN96278_c0_g1_i1.p1  ORF type:complete len:369 (-),score=47.25 TRINITY_DN96278_c0_g1_i1:13-1119(-)